MIQLRKTAYERRVLTDKERRNLLFIDFILKNGPLSRTDICHLTGFNAVTVSNYINSYLEQGLVIEKALDESTGGRKPVLVTLNPEAGFVIGVEAHAGGLVGIVINLECKTIYEIRKDGVSFERQTALDLIRDFVEKIFSEAPIAKEKIAGIGLSFPGSVDPRTGWVPRAGFFEKEETLPLSLEAFEKSFSIPVFIENEVTAAALAEKWLGLGRAVQHMIYLHSGLGCGIFIDGEIYHGAHYLAGTLPFPETEDANSRACADFGIYQAITDRIKKGDTPALSKMLEGDPKNFSIAAVNEAAAKGDDVARKVIEEAGTELGKILHYLAVLLNPEMVVLGGGIEKCGSLLFDQVKNVIRERSPDLAAHLKIIPSVFGEKAALLGAAGVVAREIFKQAR